MSEVKFRDIFIAQSDKGPIILNMEEHPDAFFSSIAKGIRYIEYAALAAKDAEIKRIKAELAEKDAVLGFYADKNNWLRVEGYWRHDIINKDLDDETLKNWEGRFSGKRAREVLQKFLPERNNPNATTK